jgi:hypothetical protein
MLAFLKQLAARFRSRRVEPWVPPPQDPDFGVREPRRRAPGGRGSVVAVAEPDEPSKISAYAKLRDRS